MPQVINTNMMALNTQRALNRSQGDLQTSLERLSSGLRINRAKDDAAGLAIANRMTAQIRGLQQAMRNANDGISMAQTVDGAMEEISNMLQRMRELAIQASNETNSLQDRQSLNDEFKALSNEILRQQEVSKFNGVAFLDGNNALSFQVGFEGGANNIIIVSTVTVSAASGFSIVLGAHSITTQLSANQLISKIDVAQNKINELRGDFGAIQNRMEATIRNIENMVENQSAARSRIQDADFAMETAQLTRAQILQQAGTAMLAQANVLPQNVLSLLQ